MRVFEKAGPTNTQETLRIALEQARAHACPIVLSSNHGETTQALLDMLQAQGVSLPIISVTHAAGYPEKGKVEMSAETRAALAAQGVYVLTAAHALTGASRSFPDSGMYPMQIVADSLRMLGQGSKVCVEVSTMALDAGQLAYGQAVVAIGGTGRGADTAMLLTPSYSADIFATRIHEIFCKPADQKQRA